MIHHVWLMPVLPHSLVLAGRQGQCTGGQKPGSLLMNYASKNDKLRMINSVAPLLTQDGKGGSDFAADGNECSVTTEGSLRRPVTTDRESAENLEGFLFTEP
uniref:Putative secreted protein n=1 Tax=Rhipicephalus microplus TaxID=6941 RepID=A0A6M2DC87_RHIMP